ncbi:MAG: uracil-DNA glycosylase [Flavobacteriales bacterium]|nr:uracil-DNA glycosylase [Flavobacteriales bacterium]
MKLNKNLKNDWKSFLSKDFDNHRFNELIDFLDKEECLVFPNEEDIFNAFNYTSFGNVKVVIIGQDPYHSYEKIDGKILPHAHGLCFSISKEAKRVPPSLKNIFKELKEDLGYEIPTHGDLSYWSTQGVLLLNSTLTVQAHEAGSHQKKGWEIFTDSVIKKISDEKEKIVFILWGKFAQKKEDIINNKKHFILKAAHPSPFSAYNGFFGCNHFSKTNKLLANNGLKEINWEIK